VHILCVVGPHKLQYTMFPLYISKFMSMSKCIYLPTRHRLYSI